MDDEAQRVKRPEVTEVAYRLPKRTRAIVDASPRRGVVQDGLRMRRRRFEVNLTQDEAATRAGVSVAWLSQLENERKSAGLEVLSKLATLYGCKIRDFLPLEESSERPKKAA